MGSKSKIEWTDATWNPIRGCSRVSEGCRHCYAEAIAARFSGTGQPYEGLARMNDLGEPRWTGDLRFVEKHLLDPLHWQRPRRVFVNSMSDLFHEKVPFEWLDRIFAVMAFSWTHVFQVLTKRPERMLEYLSWTDGDITTEDRIGGVLNDKYGVDPYKFMPDWPLPNVWLGASVEDQATADERIPLLLQTPAALRWTSYEPALGGVWLDRYLRRATDESVTVDWVVAGGESGPHARPSHPDWFRSVRDQCVAAGVPFFFKQWGEHLPWDQQKGRNDFMSPAARAAGSDRLGKKRAGHLLDGREWNEFPERTA